MGKRYNSFFLGILITFCWVAIASAQTTSMTIRALKGGGNTGSKLEKAASAQLREELGKQQSTIRNKARVTVKDAKELPGDYAKNSLNGRKSTESPKIGELIEDPSARNSIENNNNKGRFVSLFGEWWAMPNDAQLQAKMRLEYLKDSLSRIDSSKFMVPKMVNDNQFVTIFGWHPHFNGNAYQTYKYDLLTAIAYLSYDVNPFTGDYQDSTVIRDFLGGDNPAKGIVATAHAKDCKVLLSVTSHNFGNNLTFLAPKGAVAQQNLIDQLVYLMDTSKADGIEINFEQIPIEAKDAFYKFVKRLSYTLHNVGKGYTVCMSVPAFDPDGIFNLGILRNDIDFFIIKAFNFHDQPEGVKKLSVQPLNDFAGSNEPDLRSVVEHYIASIGKSEAHRLILSLANYGTLWETDNDGNSFLLDFVPYAEIRNNYIDKDSAFYDLTYNSFFLNRYDTLNGGRNINTYTLYFDDVRSLRAKYRFLQEYGLAGVGIYPLGYDIGYDDIWETLEEEFTTFKKPEIAALGAAQKATSTARGYGAVALTVILFIAIFASAGFCMSFFYKEPRRAMFESGYFRMIFLAVFTALILALGLYFGLLEGKTSFLLLGVILGSFFSYGVIAILYKQKMKSP